MDVNEHSTTKLAIKGSSALSIVLAGIAAANAASEIYEERERQEKELGNNFPANYFARAASEQYDVTYGLTLALPYLPATDLVEAAAQVGQVISEIDMAYDGMPDTDEVNVPFKKMQRRIERLLHSAIRAIETAGKFTLAEQGLSSIRCANLDPWSEMETLVKKLRDEGAK